MQMDFNTPASRWARSSLLLTTCYWDCEEVEKFFGAVPYAQHKARAHRDYMY